MQSKYPLTIEETSEDGKDETGSTTTDLLRVIDKSGNKVFAVNRLGQLTGGVGGLTTIASTTLSSSSPSITLSGLDLSTYSLVSIYGQFRVAGTGDPAGSGRFDHARMRLNGDTGSNYEFSVINSNATHAETINTTVTSIMCSHSTTSNTPANIYSSTILRFLFPGSTDKIKNCTMEWGSIDGFTGATAVDGPLGTTGVGWWNSTSAITSFTFFPQVDANWAAGTKIVIVGQ